MATSTRADLGQLSCRGRLPGPRGMGRWQQPEHYLAIDRQTRAPEFVVVPVLLPGADPVLGFLSLNTWVDLRTGLDDALALGVLEAAVRGRPPGPDLQERVTATLATVCPSGKMRRNPLAWPRRHLSSGGPAFCHCA
jgi:hypothetical protein